MEVEFQNIEIVLGKISVYSLECLQQYALIRVLPPPSISLSKVNGDGEGKRAIENPAKLK